MHSIEVDGVSKRYRIGEDRYLSLRENLLAPFRRGRGGRPERSAFWALRDVSFTVEDGDAVGIIGRNGAGKTTLLKVLSRITEPTTGVARMRGRVGALLEVGTGFHPELTGRENIYLNGAVLGMTRAEIRRRFDEIASFAGVERFLDTPIKRYSSGMYLRLAFSVAAHFEPDIVVIDEVLAVGDAEFQRKCLGRMSEFTREGRTVVFVSHDLGAIAQMCPRAIWLDDGKIEHDGPTTKSIQLYLDSRGERRAHMEFPHDPGKAVQLLSVGVTDAAGRVLDAPRRDLPFVVRVRFSVREYVGGLDVGFFILTRRGVRVLHESWSDQHAGAECADAVGDWEASATVPPVLASGDYVLGVRVASRYEVFVDDELFAFRLAPHPDERRRSIERARIVQPGVDWRLEKNPLGTPS